MNFILDVLLIVLLVAGVIMGIRRGFVRSVLRFLGAVLSACVAAIAGGAVAQWMFDVLFRDALVARLTEAVGSLEGVDAANQVLSTLPDFVVRSLEAAGINANTLAGAAGAQADQVGELMAAALEPVFVSFLKILAVIAIFLLCMVFVRIIVNVVSKVFALPLLYQLNSVLGGVFGLLQMMVFLWIALAALQFFMPMLSADVQTQASQWLQHSTVVRWMMELNPLGSIFKV